MTDIVRVLVDDSVGNAGAVRNCRAELALRRDADQQVEALCRRMSPPARVESERGTDTASA